jgi:hypothetical protein
LVTWQSWQTNCAVPLRALSCHCNGNLEVTGFGSNP